MLQALKRFRQPGFVLAVLHEQLAGLIVGQSVPLCVGADFGGCGIVSHAAATAQALPAFLQMSLRIVASAPPSISHLAPLT